jgi:hypothetical protein
MIGLTLHTLESAPAESIGILTEAKRKFGMIPNLLGILAEAPSALKAYLSIAEIFEQSSLNPTEQQVSLLHGCPFRPRKNAEDARLGSGVPSKRQAY